MSKKPEIQSTAKCCKCRKPQAEFGTVVCKNCYHAICACEVCNTKNGRKK